MAGSAKHQQNDKPQDAPKPDFIRSIVAEYANNADERTGAGNRSGAETRAQAGKTPGIRTRFPPEPNGYLHIGHAKSICLNFEIAREFSGARCNLRFDDTNPSKEEALFADSIMEDIRWLGYDIRERIFYTSDYFEQLYEWARLLISKGLAYVDSQSAEEISRGRGTPTTAGVESPYRNRSVTENLALFSAMKDGKFPDSSHVLRAKIDMAQPNLNMRDPVMYRIKHEAHPRTGASWCIYPMYDWAHGQSDAIEGISHSICTLEFENHRPLYKWFLEKLEITHPPRQIEFARLNVSATVTSKRILRQLVDEGYVQAWDDPRMPTISGMRRRGYPPAALRNFSKEVGVTKTESVVSFSLLEYLVREELNRSATRAMAVLDPIKLTITNYPDGKREVFSAENNPEDPQAARHDISFSKQLYIERSDCLIDPPPKFFRLALGRKVRLKYAYIVQCNEIICSEDGSIAEVRCSYDPESRGGLSPDGTKVKGTIHWVNRADAVDAELRLYEPLFTEDDPRLIAEDFRAHINPDSLRRIRAKVEPFLAQAGIGEHFQFLRTGYFTLDSETSNGETRNTDGDAKKALVFNRTAQLRDSWSKLKHKH